VIRLLKRAEARAPSVAAQNLFKFPELFKKVFLCKGVNTQNNEHLTTNHNERKVMNDKFDELAKNMAQSVTRRGALKKFGVGLAGIALASLGWRSTGRPPTSG
jgi:hypothetical protein